MGFYEHLMVLLLDTNVGVAVGAQNVYLLHPSGNLILFSPCQSHTVSPGAT